MKKKSSKEKITTGGFTGSYFNLIILISLIVIILVGLVSLVFYFTIDGAATGIDSNEEIQGQTQAKVTLEVLPQPNLKENLNHNLGEVNNE